jgi:Protein of unknown function (DUF3313)
MKNRLARMSWTWVMVLAGSALLSFMPAVALAVDSSAQQWDGLERRDSKSLDAVYVRPNVQFKAYKSVRLDPVSVAFDKNWDPNRDARGASRLSSSDIQRIREELAKSFRKVFAERLGKDGYALVDADADDVLRVQAGLINVYINAPDTMSAGRSRTYVMDAGRMTVVMQLADSVSGQLLARVVDTKQASSYGRLQWSNSVSNSAEAQRAFGQWADALCKALDEVDGRAK